MHTSIVLFNVKYSFFDSTDLNYESKLKKTHLPKAHTLTTRNKTGTDIIRFTWPHIVSYKYQ